MSSPGPILPPVLARYPEEAQVAYRRFVLDHNEADLRILIHAALRDFMPRRSDPVCPAGFTPEHRLIDDLGLDSLAVTEMVFFFEDLFQVSIPSQEILSLRTVADIEHYVSRKLREKLSAT